MKTSSGTLAYWLKPSLQLATYIALSSVLLHANYAVALSESVVNSDTSNKENQRLIETVVVTGTRTPYSLIDSPVEVQLIDAAQIARSGARDVAELLEREGGVYANRAAGRGSAIQIQGLSSEHVLILVNGRRMIGRINGAIDLSRLHVADIERIEIVKGPSSALYGGDALGGVVNIISQRKGEGGALILRADDAGNQDVFGQLALNGDSLSASLSGGYSHLDGFDLDKSTIAEDGVVGDSTFGGVSGNWQANEQFGVDFDLAYSLDDTERNDGGTGGAVYKTYKQIEETRLGVRPKMSLENSTLTVDFYYNRYYDQFLQDQIGSNDNTIDEETVNELMSAGLQWDISPSVLNTLFGEHLLSVGAEFQIEELDADRLGQVAERDRQAVYIQDDLQLADGRLHLVPGLRLDRDSQFGDQLSPKLAMRYDISDTLFTRIGYGQGYRPPSFRELLLRFDNPSVGYRVEGNLDLKPESSTGFNFGLSWLPSPQHSVSISAYNNEVEDLIDIIQVATTPSVIFSYRNVSRASLMGLDMQWAWQPEILPEFNLQFGYGYLWSEDKATGEELSGRPKQRANLALAWDTQRYYLALRGTWTDSRTFGVELDAGGPPTGAGEAEAYTLLDARAAWKGFAPFELAVGLDNISDAGDSQYLPIQPRNAYLEVKWNLK
ncbi:MAG: outer membrane receptor for ferrienterochelin and colicins [Zhongshania marina]|jgi:outer membrane receptor for ferrienterochelin and colicins